MNKNYIMFINENIFRQKDNSVIVGIVFDESYCTSTHNKISQVEDKLKKFKELNSDSRDMLAMLKKLKFKIVISESIKYNLCIKDLFKEFNLYLERVNSDFGKVIFKDKKNLVSAKKVQGFFDMFNEYCDNSIISKKINSFMVYDGKDIRYRAAFEVCDMIYEILNKVYDEDLEKERLNIYETLSDKYVDINFLNELYKERKLDIKLLLSEIENLQYEVKIKNKNIVNSKLTISKLKEEIEKLKEQIRLSIKNTDNVSLNIFQKQNIEDGEYSEV